MQQNYYNLKEEHFISEQDWIRIQSEFDPDVLDDLVSSLEVKDGISHLWLFFPVKKAFYKHHCVKPTINWNDRIIHTFFFKENITGTSPAG